MGSAARQWRYMVNLICRSQLSGLLAFLTERVFTDKAITNPLPCAAITPLTGRIAPVFVIMRRDNFLVFLTIAPVGQARASGIGTGALGFVWHKLPPPFGQKESPRRLLPRRPCCIPAVVSIVILPDFQGVFLCLLVSSFLNYQIEKQAFMEYTKKQKIMCDIDKESYEERIH